MDGLRCATCQTDNPAGARFCGGCGAAVGTPEPLVADSSLGLAGPPVGAGQGNVWVLLTLSAGLVTAGVLLIRNANGRGTGSVASVAIDAAAGTVGPAHEPPPDAASPDAASPDVEGSLAAPIRDAAFAVPRPVRPAIAGGIDATAPVDPYADRPSDAAVEEAVDPGDDLANQIDRVTSASRVRLDRCYVQASKSLPPEHALEGDVEIAFQILPVGQIRNPAVVSDTTGSQELGSCLVAVVESWQFSTSDLVGPADFVKKFRFRTEGYQ